MGRAQNGSLCSGYVLQSGGRHGDGQGEHLSALAVLLGVPGVPQAELFAFVQECYRELGSRAGNSSGALIKALDKGTLRHSVFAKMSQAN